MVSLFCDVVVCCVSYCVLGDVWCCLAILVVCVWQCVLLLFCFASPCVVSLSHVVVYCVVLCCYSMCCICCWLLLLIVLCHYFVCCICCWPSLLLSSLNRTRLRVKPNRKPPLPERWQFWHVSVQIILCKKKSCLLTNFLQNWPDT